MPNAQLRFRRLSVPSLEASHRYPLYVRRAFQPVADRHSVTLGLLRGADRAECLRGLERFSDRPAVDDLPLHSRRASAASNRRLPLTSRRIETDRQPVYANGVAMSRSAAQNIGHLNAVGSTRRTASAPSGKARIASAMKIPSASRTPTALTPQEAHEKPVAGMRSRDWVTRVPHTIISDAIQTGASTGPHHGSGHRKRMSQSNRGVGKTEMMRRKT